MSNLLCYAYSIVHSGLGYGDLSGRKFYGLGRAPENRADRIGREILDQAYHNVLLVNKNNIKGEPHKEHVDRIAAGYDQCFAIRQARAAQEAAEAAQERVCQDHLVS
jgi:hypothetical protein